MTDFVTSLRKDMKESVIPTIKEFIMIPNKSRAFNPTWKTDGMNEKVI